MTDGLVSPGSTRVELKHDIGFLLSIARSIVVRRANDALGPEGLRVGSYSLLAMAADADGVTQSEAAGALRLNPSQIVVLVDELEGRGLVDRRPHPTDRRSRIIVPTEAGRRTCEEAGSRLAAMLDQVLDGLDHAERSTLHDLLQKLIRTVDEADSRP